MPAYVIYDVDIRDPELYQEYMLKVKPAVAAGGGEYLARGGEFKIIEGDWQPRRLVLFKFPSMAKAEAFYNSELYRSHKALRDKCSSSNIVIVEG